MSRKYLSLAGLVVATVLIASSVAGYTAFQRENGKIKVAFLYVGPKQYGWSYMHEVARGYIDEKFPWLETVYAEDVSEAEIDHYIERFILEEGCEVLAFTEDSPAVVRTGQEYTEKGKPVYTFASYSPMQKLGPDSCVSGQLVHWEVLYEDILTKVYAGIYTSRNLADVDCWWMLPEKAVELGGELGGRT